MSVVRITTKGAKRHHLAVKVTVTASSGYSFPAFTPLCGRPLPVRTIYRCGIAKPLCSHCAVAAENYANVAAS